MPMYEYRCEACGSPFALRRTIDQRDAATTCPHCAATNIVRLVSTFAAFSHGDGNTISLNSSQCSSCGSTTGCGGCGVNRN